MDKDWKLRQYRRKDYSELVDFPVEIVGRDGVVRRYLYEDAIRLYQRRMTLAAARYTDSELVGAEVGHCRARIGQLRHSYFHVFGWGTPVGNADPRSLLGELCGEVAAFLGRALRSEHRLEMSVTALEPGECPQVWYVMDTRLDDGLMLYVYRFSDDETSEEAGRAFFDALKEFGTGEHGAGDREQVLAFHHTADCGLMLTGPANMSVMVDALAQAEPHEPAGATPWDLAMSALRRGDHAEALGMCREIVTDQEFHLRGYVAGALLGLALARDDDADDLAMLGRRRFPRDATLAFSDGLVRLHRREPLPAVTAFEQAAANGIASEVIAPFVVRAAMMSNRPWVIARVVYQWRAPLMSAQGSAVHHHAHRALGFWVVAVMALLVGVVNAIQVWPFGMLPLAVIVGLVCVGRAVLEERAVHLLRRLEDDEVARQLRRAQRRPERPVT